MSTGVYIFQFGEIREPKVCQLNGVLARPELQADKGPLPRLP